MWIGSRNENELKLDKVAGLRERTQLPRTTSQPAREERIVRAHMRRSPGRMGKTVEPMHDFEKLGLFYLGKTYDVKDRKVTSELVLFESKHLTTHAVCVGMTGSGKTGLGIGLLEEAAIDGIPVIAIDPKGDLGNLLLGFPELRAEDFLPWVDADEAGRRGKTVEEFAAQTA